MEQGKTEQTSEFAQWGTAAHSLAETCLTAQSPPAAYEGRIFAGVEVDAEMVECVDTYIASVRQYAEGNDLMVEQRVPIGHLTGEADAEGTSDAIIITADGEELQVHDLKGGRGVRVDAEENDQGQIYALGALELVRLLGHEPKRVRIVIHQPRVSRAPSEWDCSVGDLMTFGTKVGERAFHALAVLNDENPAAYIHHLHPGEKQCKFCKAKAECPALAQHALNTVAGDFVDVTADVGAQLTGVVEQVQKFEGVALADLLPHLDLIREWCDAVQKHAHAELLAGHDVPGYKLVQGKRGSRGWGDEAEAEAAMKAMRLKQDEMYNFKVISPTQAEKLLAKDSPRRWVKLQALITQAEGKPSVVPITDARPAFITATANDFDAVGDLV